MMKKFFNRKLLILFISIFLIGFFIGYDYSMLQAGKAETAAARASQKNETKARDDEGK